MEQDKYDQLWDEIILKAIEDYISKHSEYVMGNRRNFFCIRKLFGVFRFR